MNDLFPNCRVRVDKWGVMGDFDLFLFLYAKKICRKTYESKRKYLMDMSLCIDFGDIFLDLTDIVFRNIEF